ncbi:hypothetical protein ACFQNE_03005 [Gordonia phosphorivorans]|uniref:Uncharacterized protein n=1 Tax=Gordonia phosphorivorans TaxID=1056982 RepID=A0ABV6H4V1_9ACTN
MTPAHTVYKLGFYGCAHLGYRMNGMARQHSSGLNIREVDGYVSYEQVMDDMIGRGVQAIVDGGDTFHTHRPSPRAIDEALRVDDKRVAAQIPRDTNSGNHDAASSSEVSAVASVHRPSLGSFAVYPRTDRTAEDTFGPHPGLYEVHQPDPNVPLYLHIVSHYGLNPRLADKGIVIDPRPIPDGVNILVSHGLFAADDRLFGATDGHGATRMIPAEWVDRGFDASILSDYHTPGPIPGYGPQDRKTGQVWMTGSLLGRGFSDEICSRGWLLVELGSDGYLTVTLQPIWWRPQVDFDPIDCDGKTVEDINAIVRKRLASQRWWDEESAALTGDGGYLLRQRIVGASPAQRQGVRARAGEWANAAGEAAFWGVSFTGSSTQRLGEAHKSRGLSRSTRQVNFAEDFTERATKGRVGAVLAGAAPEIREAATAATVKTLTVLQADPWAAS